MDADQKALVAAHITAGMLASGHYNLPKNPADAAEIAVHLFRHVRGELIEHSTPLRSDEE